MSQLELAARAAWVEWGDGFALWSRCAGCQELRHVRGKRRSWMLCLECWDLVGPRVRTRAHAVSESNRQEEAWS